MGRIPAVEQLARSGPAEFAAARAHRDHLLASARSLVVAAHHDQDVARCEEASCALVEGAGTDLCSAAHRLARIDDGPTDDLAVTAALDAFRSRLAASLDAIRVCRQTVHPGGACWFSTSPGEDGCAEILQLAHRSSQ